ncbi:oxidoreductase [Sorangium cellulosum]|uniref:Oxidoreductase n=1 Tax=Sorangium cellulosum TaxID=56 RepID=A0A4P2Q3H8_SORCE|nr:aldo/keto reductase [Sorangium cellulosum]AUX23880.1 oxidoreductase [Sorangium cellulosum]
MKTIDFAGTGAQISSLCLGCMYLGTKTDQETSYALLDLYHERGGRFLDTSNNYAFWVNGRRGGDSESLIGRWMKERRNRGEIFLATKVGARPTAPGAGLEAAEGLTAKAIARAVDESLSRLGTDHIDLYYAHIDQRTTPLEETLEALDGLVRQGKVRHLGCSNMATWRIAEARTLSRLKGWAPYRCVQQWHSYLRPRPGTGGIEVPAAGFTFQLNVDDELLDYCKSNKDFTIVAYSPLLLGAYARADRPLPEKFLGADADARLRALESVAKETGRTRNQVVLAWLRQSGPAVVSIVAASTPEQLRENLGSLDLVLSEEQMRTLSEAHG